MKILNLFCGLGGNRADWPGDHGVIAVDSCPGVLERYAERYPQDEVVEADAYEFLLSDYPYYDFIWASPPCQTHSAWNRTMKSRYADMRLYSLIVFLKEHFDGLYCVENVKPYYGELIPAFERGRHLLWSNFWIPEFNVPEIDLANAGICELKKFHGVEFERGVVSRQELRNMCHRKIGRVVLETALEVFEGPRFEKVANGELF